MGEERAEKRRRIIFMINKQGDQKGAGNYSASRHAAISIVGTADDTNFKK